MSLILYLCFHTRSYLVYWIWILKNCCISFVNLKFSVRSKFDDIHSVTFLSGILYDNFHVLILRGYLLAYLFNCSTVLEFCICNFCCSEFCICENRLSFIAKMACFISYKKARYKRFCPISFSRT